MSHVARLLPWLLLVSWIALLWHGRRCRRRPWLLGCCLALLTLAAWPPTARLAMATLELRYPARILPPRDAEVIVVLSGSVYPVTELNPYPRLAENTRARTRFAAWLYHHWQARPILACGGTVRRDGDLTPLAEPMRESLLRLGVAQDDVWIETHSRNTHENARFAAEILAARGVSTVALVTEAYHMPRAAACFEKQGLDVVPAPCVFRSRGQRWSWRDLAPSARAWIDVELAVHEWLGLGWYLIRGHL